MTNLKKINKIKSDMINESLFNGLDNLKNKDLLEIANEQRKSKVINLIEWARDMLKNICPEQAGLWSTWSRDTKKELKNI